MNLEALALSAAVLTAAVVTHVIRKKRIEKEKKKRRTHSIWSRPWFGDRNDQGKQNTVYKFQLRLKECDPHEFRRLMRMSPEVYDMILEKIRPAITKKNTNWRLAIPAEERLTMTLRFLCSGDIVQSVAYANRVSRTSVCRIIFATTKAIIDAFKDTYMKTPTTAQEWMGVERGFRRRWNYPGCIGAIDGKHIRLQKPANSGSVFFNFKSYFSLVLLAVVNSNYEILYAEVGTEGRISDGGVWQSSPLLAMLKSGSLNLPPDQPLDGWDKDIPCHIVGDNAFGMTSRLLKPFPERGLDDRKLIFNYRLSRARRVVENVFGILASRFQILHRPLRMRTVAINRIVMCICILHNMLRRYGGKNYIPSNMLDAEDCNGQLIPGEWRNSNKQFADSEASKNKHYNVRAKQQREMLADYFISKEGELDFQYKRVVTYTQLSNMIDNPGSDSEPSVVKVIRTDVYNNNVIVIRTFADSMMY